MVHDWIDERRSEALAAERRTQYVPASAVGARKCTFRTDKVRDLGTASFPDRTALAERYRNHARLRRSRANTKETRLDADSFRDRELQWLAAHRHEYPGLWLALDGDALVASSQSLAEVLRQARRKGSPNPLVAWSNEIAEAPFGGW
jgi:hypothetical protein